MWGGGGGKSSANEKFPTFCQEQLVEVKGGSSEDAVERTFATIYPGMDFTGITSPTSMFLASHLYNSISGDLVKSHVVWEMQILYRLEIRLHSWYIHNENKKLIYYL